MVCFQKQSSLFHQCPHVYASASPFTAGSCSIISSMSLWSPVMLVAVNGRTAELSTNERRINEVVYSWSSGNMNVQIRPLVLIGEPSQQTLGDETSMAFEVDSDDFAFLRENGWYSSSLTAFTSWEGKSRSVLGDSFWWECRWRLFYAYAKLLCMKVLSLESAFCSSRFLTRNIATRRSPIPFDELWSAMLHLSCQLMVKCRVWIISHVTGRKWRSNSAISRSELALQFSRVQTCSCIYGTLQNVLCCWIWWAAC